MAARYRLPTVYPYPLFVADGGLIAYGPDAVDSFRLAAWMAKSVHNLVLRPIRQLGVDGR
jgi:hypothetical protein